MVTVSDPASGPSVPVNPMAQAIAQAKAALAELERVAGPQSPAPEITGLLLELAEADEAFEEGVRALDFDSDELNALCSRAIDAERAVTNHARQVAGLPPR